jgi:hypothetical protein
VALVYSPSEPLEPRPGSSVDALARAALAHSHYTSALGAVRLLISDAWAALHERSGAPAPAELRPRADMQLPDHHHSRLSALAHAVVHPRVSAAPPPVPEPLGILRALEDDVATYVVRNDLRERVRGFVANAVLALLDREDVDRIVVNAHSQGTVICWDVLCRLPFSSWRANGDSRAGKLGHFVTAGSPIRKYIDMFAWGAHVGELAALHPIPWVNFWDPHDPVADPLDPPAAWRPGDPVPPAAADTDADPDPDADGDGGLLVAVDAATGEHRHVRVDDRSVDNIDESSGGGLQAHHYWGNQRQFVEPLAALLGLR